MGHLWMGEKPNYDKKKISEYLSKLRFKFKEFDDLDFADVNEWCSNIIKKTKDINTKILIDINITEDSSGGCGCGPQIITMTPYYERLETDKEYKDRIKEEEKQYQENLEKERLRKENQEQYLKDIEEYNRIKNKYHLY